MKSEDCLDHADIRPDSIYDGQEVFSLGDIDADCKIGLLALHYLQEKPSGGVGVVLYARRI